MTTIEASQTRSDDLPTQAALVVALGSDERRILLEHTRIAHAAPE